MMNPKVSVLMTVYNDENFIKYSIESILNQTFREFEFIIINDGSIDGTLNIIDEYKKKDSRIFSYTISNSGTTKAANYGLKIAKGEYIARIDSDDISYSTRLSDQVTALDSQLEVGLIGGGMDIIDVHGLVVGCRNIMTKHPQKTLIHRCIFQQSDVMFRRSLVLDLGGYREKFYNAQDYDLWIRISEKSEIIKSDKVWGQWRLNRGGYTLSRAEEQKKEVKIIKLFAKQRMKNGKDSYDLFVPKDRLSHRKILDNNVYEFWVGKVLLKSLRREESRIHFLNYFNSNKSIIAFIFYLSTFSPLIILRYIFLLREYLLNRM